MKTLVFIETDEGTAVASSWEALGKARELGGDVSAVVIGHDIAQVADEAGRRGAQTVYTVDDPGRAVFDLDAYLADIKGILDQNGADIFLASHTTNGRDLAAALAVDLGVGIIADCLELQLVDGRLQGVRPLYSGNILADVTVDGTPQIATIRPRAAAPAAPGEASGNVVQVAPAPVEPRVQVEKVEHAEA
ncbi:MAG: hypothetical protein D6775_04590, partial [Caldilineae bacterium]